MLKKRAIALSILLSSSIAPLVSNAESTTATKPIPVAASTSDSDLPPTTTPANNSSEMSKKTWLETVSPMLPALICKGFMRDKELKHTLDSIKMTYEHCLRLIPDSVTKCKNQVNSTIPDTISSTDTAILGKTLGECIGKDFAMKYFIAK